MRKMAFLHPDGIPKDLFQVRSARCSLPAMILYKEWDRRLNLRACHAAGFRVGANRRAEAALSRGG